MGNIFQYNIDTVLGEEKQTNEPNESTAQHIIRWMSHLNVQVNPLSCNYAYF